jgi:hypothetical protein
MVLLYGLAWEESRQIVHGGHEVASLHCHGEIDRVEIGLTGETAAQIRARVDRRAILAATGAQEGQLSLAHLVRPLQLAQQRRPRDVVA